MPTRWIALVIVVLCLSPRWALADDLDDALALEEQGLLMEALEAFQALLDEGGRHPDELATIYLHLAILQQASGDGEAARGSMYRLLAVEPEPELPVSAPPAVAELLEEGRRLWAGRRLRAEARPPGELEAAEEARVEITVIDDVPGLVAAAALVEPGGRVVAEQAGRGPFELSLPPQATVAELSLEVQLRDERGGVLWQGAGLTLRWRPVIEEGSTPPTPESPVVSRDPSLWVSGWSLLAAGVVLGGGGGALVGVDQNRTGEQRVTDLGLEAEVLNTDIGGWVLVGLGAAALVAGVVLLILSPRRGSRAPEAIARLTRGVLVEF